MAKKDKLNYQPGKLRQELKALIKGRVDKGGGKFQTGKGTRKK